MTQARLICHGGAGPWSDTLDAGKAVGMREATRIGWEVLQAGGSALDAVEKSVNYLEDFPLFDAGIGSHLNEDGMVELDALIVDGATHNFGAVAGVKRIRYPVSLARRILEETPQCFFVAEGAERVAQQFGIPLIPNELLITEAELLFHQQQFTETTSDTVGAVAIDQFGNLASATSTGGTPNKPAGRVGDSPCFGGGGFAHNQMGAAGCTGVGENIVRVLLAKYATDQMANGNNAQQAATISIDYINQFYDHSNAGIITVDRNGNIGAAHSTPKLALGWVDHDGEIQTSMQNGVL